MFFNIVGNLFLEGKKDLCKFYLGFKGIDERRFLNVLTLFFL